MSDHFILEGKIPKPADLIEWARWYETADRHVASDMFETVRVSTVFLGLDHSFGEGPLLLFETMIFGGEHDDFQTRCSTWEQAEEMHETACALVRREELKEK